MAIQAFQTCPVGASYSTFHAVAHQCPASFQVREKHPAFIAGEYLVRPFIDGIAGAFSWFDRVTTLPGAAAEEVRKKEPVSPTYVHFKIDGLIHDQFRAGHRYDDRYQNVLGIPTWDRDLAEEALTELIEDPTKTNIMMGLMHTQARRVMKLFLKVNDVCRKNMTRACKNGMENLRRLNVNLQKREVHISEIHQGPSLLDGVINSLSQIWNGIKNSGRHDF